MPDSTPENFEDLQEAVKDIHHRLDTIEDKVMMERLEDMALEDEIEVVQQLVERGEQDLKAKINLLDTIEEKYEEERLDEKLRYLYSRIKELDQEQIDTTELREDIDDLRDDVEQLSTQVAESSGSDEDLDDIYDKLYLLRDKVKELKEEGTDAADIVREDDLDEFEERLQEQLDRKHGEKVKRQLAETEERVTEMVEETEQTLREEIEEHVTDIEDQLRETLEALEYQVDEQEEAIETLRSQIPGEEWQDSIDERLDAVAETADKNAKAVEYALEEHEDDIERLKELLQSLPPEMDDDRYNELLQDVSGLEERLGELKESMTEDAIKRDVVGMVLQETDAWAEMEDSLDSVHTEMRALSAEMENDIEESLAGVRSQVSQLATALSDVTDEVDAVSQNVDRLTDNIEHVTDHLSEAEEQHTQIRNNLDELRQRISAVEASAADVEPEDILEALEYSSDEIWNRMEEILVRMEHLRDDIDTQSERIDGLAESQNIFESEIRELMQNQKTLNEEFEREDTRVQQQLDLLLEALEEGLEEEERRLSTGVPGVEDALEEELAAAEEQITELQRNMDHIEVEQVESEGPHRNMKQLTKIVVNNREQLNELTERIRELQDIVQETASNSPTIIE